MRIKTSVTLPRDLLADIDRLDGNRSAFLERAARHYISEASKAERDARDARIINRNAARLNAEGADVLEYQGWPK